MKRLIPITLALVLPVVAAAQDTAAVDTYASRCGATVSASDRGGWAPLPRGDVFCPLIADPKSMKSSVAYQRGREEDLANDIAAVSLADAFGFFRTGSHNTDNAIQLGISGAVFAQFDVGTPSYDLLNADYLIALPLTFRAGWLSGRVRVYHQSSHLGDELLLRPNPPKRENLSFESLDGLLSADIGPLRLYGGGEQFFGRDSSDLPNFLIHSGAELRPRAAVRFGTLGLMRLIAAVDVKNVNDTTVWRTGVSARAGFEISRPREGAVNGRRWGLYAQYYDGPSPFGQFLRSDVRLVGLGFDFSM